MLSNIAPFKMLGEIYFVGSTAVSVHMINTSEGLVLIDSGYPNMYEQILESIQILGFDPKKICAVFLSHGHYDHFGCARELRALSGAKLYISEIDHDIVNGKLDLSWAKELGYERLPAFSCDVLVKDSDVFSFGDTQIRCRLTPGHTDGTLSFFINAKEGDKNYVAAMHGGIGTNSMRASFLREYGLPFDCRDRFREGLHKLASEHVDLVLGNHPQQNDTEAKLAAVLEGKSIVDETEWQRFLVAAEKYLDAVIEMENN